MAVIRFSGEFMTQKRLPTSAVGAPTHFAATLWSMLPEPNFLEGGVEKVFIGKDHPVEGRLTRLQPQLRPPTPTPPPHSPRKVRASPEREGAWSDKGREGHVTVAGKTASLKLHFKVLITCKQKHFQKQE